VHYPAAAAQGVVLEAGSGEPIRGARIALESEALRTSRSLADKLIAIGHTYASTAGDGAFVLPHVEPGTYTLAVVKPGYAARTYTNVSVGPGGVSGLRIELSPGQAALELTVHVGEERAVQGSFAVLRDASGADVGLHGIPLEGTVTFEGLAAGVHTLLLYVPNEPVIVHAGIALAANTVTPLTVTVPK